MMLTSVLRDRVTLVWLLLIVATLASWILGVGHELPDEWAAIGILCIAFAKVHCVGAYFMELRHAPVALRVVFSAWNVVVALMLIGLYVVA